MSIKICKNVAELTKFYLENKSFFDAIQVAVEWLATTGLPNLLTSIIFVAKMLIKVIDSIMKGFAKIGGFIGNIIGTIMSIPTLLSMAFNTLKTNVMIILTEIAKFIQKIIDGIKFVVGKVPFISNAIGGGGSVRQTQTNNTTNNNTNITNNYGSTWSDSPRAKLTPAYVSAY